MVDGRQHTEALQMRHCVSAQQEVSEVNLRDRNRSLAPLDYFLFIINLFY